MLLSIFTPTHNPRHLEEAYASLNRQGDIEWEWVVVPNGPCTPDAIPEKIRNDIRVRVVPFEGESTVKPTQDTINPAATVDESQSHILTEDGRIKIGALKRFACEQARGDAFVELDHDDMLVPRTLEKIAGRLQSGAGFVFSDAASFIPDRGNLPFGYDPRYGWETYNFKVYGKDFLAHRSFPVTARSLCEIFYAPDHVRCWSRGTYFKAGGHDRNMLVADDHDLICRTYLSGTPFAHTGGCGYLYRSHPGNTYRAWNAEVIQQQAQNCYKYAHRLLDEWCRRNSFRFINLQDEGKLQYDDDGRPKIAAEANTVGCIKAYDVSQYVPQEYMAEYMNEIWRVLRPGGWVCMAAPSTSGHGAFAPHYKSYWNPHVFLYFTESEHAKKVGSVRCRFQPLRVWEAYPHEEHRKHKLNYVYADLIALKGQRQPGRVEI